MCTSSCNYDGKFAYLRRLVEIRSDNNIYRELQGKTNLDCVNSLLTEVTSKVVQV